MKRDKSIDLLKGFLTITMILAHIIQFFPLNKLTASISNYINLTAFSGFMFCFGYVSYITYTKKTNKNIYNKNLLKHFCKTIAVFYICAIAYTLLISNNFTYKELLNILILQKVPGYCEFLLSFSFLYILIYIFKDKLFQANNKLLIFLIILSLLTTQINYEKININLIGIFIGTTKFNCFPIIQYLFYFIGGIYFAKNKIVFNKKIYAITLISTLSFISYFIITKRMPNRFPPSILWIIGGAEFIYLYYISFKKIKSNNKLISTIEKVGKNTLSYLTLSNIIIFLTYNILKKYNTNLNTKKETIIIYILLIILCIVIPYLYNHIIKKTKQKPDN